MDKKTLFIIFAASIVLFITYIWYVYYLKDSMYQQDTINTINNEINNTEELNQQRNIERQVEQIEVSKNPPEIEQLANLVNEFENNNTKWDILIAVGDIYRKGAYPRFLPNEEIAMRCYKIAAMCPDGKIAGMGQSKYIEARTDTIKNEDKAGNEFPIVYGLKICDLAESSIQSMPWHMFEKPEMTKKQKEPDMFAATDNFALFENIFQRPERVEISEVLPQYRIDSQNVHDHGVSKITKHNIDELAKNIDINRINNNDMSIDSIRDTILQTKDVTPEMKEDALHVLDKLGDSKHSSFNVTEKEALALVWDKINKTNDPNIQSNLKETLVKQLASAVEHGHIVCSSGKITRIMSTLDGVSNEPVRPTWALREELGTLAAKLRDKFDDNTPMADQKIRDEFEKQVRNEYINKLGMSPKIIDPLIAEYSEGF